MNIATIAQLLFRLLDLLPKIQEARRLGTPILALLKTFAPDLIDFIRTIGGVLFPTLTPEQQVEAGAQKLFDQTQVRWVQDSINKLGAAPKLVVDGDYGQKTKDAVMSFQKKHPTLVADGWAGKMTNAVIQTELNKLTPVVPVAA